MGQGTQPSAAETPDGWHFLLLAGGAGAFNDADALSAQLRRMGLRPDAIADMPAALAGTYHPPSWQVRLGSLQVQLAMARRDGWVMGDAAAATGVDPAKLAPALLVTPQAGAQDAARVGQSRELFKLACLLADAVDAQQFYWSPARLWSPMPVFRRAVEEMLTSGMPPVLHLVAFPTDEAGRMMTRGLAFYCGQELVVTAANGLPPPEQLRRLARLAIDMMANGPIRAARRFQGMVAGEMVAVAPPPPGADPARLSVAIERA